MINLHKAYKTLLRRGMPAHPAVRWGGMAHWYSGVVGHEPVEMCEPDARDLITAHALRWLYGDNARYFTGDVLGAILADTDHLEPSPTDA